MNFEIKIIFEDDDFLAIDKPAGITVNRADTTEGVETIQDWVERKFPLGRANLEYKENLENDEFLGRSGIVHRLDKETSGILLIAKNKASFENLQTQFHDRKVEKEYIALAHGKLFPEKGEINVPVGRLPWNRKKFGVIPLGRESRTQYEVTAYKRFSYQKKQEDLSLLRLFPKTGRTHQIRVHLLYTGHPIFADELYAGRKTAKIDRKILNRHFLHATRISFMHPKTGNHIILDSPLPLDLSDFLSKLS